MIDTAAEAPTAASAVRLRPLVLAALIMRQPLPGVFYSAFATWRSLLGVRYSACAIC
jgi:hypothetical protein